MKARTLVFTLVLGAVFLAAGTTAWGAKGGIPGKPPPNEDPLPETPIDGFYFWRWGHMDGPHDSAKALAGPGGHRHRRTVPAQRRLRVLEHDLRADRL
jgi:hypothetical protein